MIVALHRPKASFKALTQRSSLTKQKPRACRQAIMTKLPPLLDLSINLTEQLICLIGNFSQFGDRKMFQASFFIYNSQGTQIYCFQL